MEVIDILNKIANGEEVPKVIKKQWKYEWQYDAIREEYTYMQETGERFDEDWLVVNILNDEVEIIEEDKKIEKIPYQFSLNYIYCNINETAKEEINKTINEIYDKMNEIIDYLNKEKE